MNVFKLGQKVMCIFHTNVRSITKKTNDPKVFKLGIGNDLDQVMWFWGSKVKVNSVNRNYSVCSNSMSSF